MGAYGCLPYIMRYRSKDDAPWEKSKYRGLYIQLARWCNQPSFFKTLTLRQFCERNQKYAKSDKTCASMRALKTFEADYPELVHKLFDTMYYKEEHNARPL